MMKLLTSSTVLVEFSGPRYGAKTFQNETTFPGHSRQADQALPDLNFHLGGASSEKWAALNWRNVMQTLGPIFFQIAGRAAD